MVISNYFDKGDELMKIKINFKFNFKVANKYNLLYTGRNKNLFTKSDKKDYNSKFNFKLTPTGAEIGVFHTNYKTNNYEWLRLTTSHGKVLKQVEGSFFTSMYN
jgi:hypothetical protein